MRKIHCLEIFIVCILQFFLHVQIIILQNINSIWDISPRCVYIIVAICTLVQCDIRHIIARTISITDTRPQQHITACTNLESITIDCNGWICDRCIRCQCQSISDSSKTYRIACIDFFCDTSQAIFNSSNHRPISWISNIYKFFTGPCSINPQLSIWNKSHKISVISIAPFFPTGDNFCQYIISCTGKRIHSCSRPRPVKLTSRQ